MEKFLPQTDQLPQVCVYCKLHHVCFNSSLLYSCTIVVFFNKTILCNSTCPTDVWICCLCECMCLSLAGVQSQILWIQINGELLRMLSITMPMSYGNLKLCSSSAIQSMCHCLYHIFLSFFLPGCLYKFITEMTCGGVQKQDKWRTAHLQILKGGVFRNGWTMDHLWSVNDLWSECFIIYKWMADCLQVWMIGLLWMGCHGPHHGKQVV